MDFASATEALPLAGSVGVPERFHRLIWGNSPSDTTSLPVSPKGSFSKTDCNMLVVLVQHVSRLHCAGLELQQSTTC